MLLLLFSCSVVSSSLLFHGLQHARLPCPHVILKKKKTLAFSRWLSGKESAAVQETQARSLGQEDPLEKGMAAHSRILAWEIPWTEEPGRLQSMGSQRINN